ncbi:MAG: chromosomal replication initiator protein [Thermoleophilaceae bacterium]|nr:chromosomal replication initiator protein [Thermoleophilaceae bacterium]
MPQPAGSEPPLPDALAGAWDRLSRELRREVTDFTFHIWLEPLEPVGHVGGTLFLRAPDHIRTWVEDSFLPVLRRAAANAGVAESVEVVDERWAPPVDTAAALGGGPPVAGEPLNPRYTFERFVICDGNRLAHGAALAVAEQPAQTYNPLFIHGPPGLGKTHLLHAIGNYVQAYGVGLTVRYVTVEDFTAEFVRAVRSGETRPFRERFRGADVLLVDDVQFLEEKLRTEEEFFHTFNALYEAGSQLVITSDRRPRDIGKLETRLRERFECGLVAQLDAPAFDARLAILEQRSRADALAGVSHATLAEIAGHVSTSVRALEGALIRVVAYASLRGDEPSPELARRVLTNLYGDRPAEPSSLEAIQAAAAAALDVPTESLLAHDRRPRVSLARQVAMYLARELTDQSLPAIGRHFGGRNHSTVLHAHRRIAGDLGKRQETTGAVDRARSELRELSADRG